MNQAEIEILARDAGLPADRAQIAAAIAMAESGGNPNAHAHDSDDDSYGLWQINMNAAAGGAARRARFGLSSNEQLYDPKTNATVMSELSHQGANFSPWTTYTTNDPARSYKRFYDANRAPATGAAAGGGWTDTVAKAGDALTKTARWVSNAKNWARVAYVIGGGILVYAAVETLVLPYTSKAVGAVMGPAGKVAGKVGL